MIDVAPIIRRDDRVLRAALFALAVLAQLLLPALVLRAEAFAGDLCVTETGDGAQKSKAHDHGQQCAHCRLHDCSPVAPPTATEVAFAPPPASAAPFAVFSPPPGFARLAQPPPTGPPVS